MISLDFNNSSFAYCSQFTIYFDKEKSIWSLSYYFTFGRGNKTEYKSNIALDFNSGLFSISFAYCSQFTIYFDEKRVFEVFLTILDLADETRLRINLWFP